MAKSAALQSLSVRGLRFGSLVLLLASLVTVCFGGAAKAKPRSFVGRDGKIHACYRVKGKPKGMVRVVRGGHYRCHRGERRMAWSVATTTGTTGSGGAAGAQGDSGTVAGPNEAALKTQIGELSARVEALEKILAGVSNEDLTKAVNAVPAVESLCENSEELNEQVDLVAEAVEGLGLNGALTGIGGLLEIPPLPKPLGPFAC
jgi:hypothetical protein